jgi:hypothetical protein
MRNALAAALLAVGLVGFSVPASAHDRGHNVCWGTADGKGGCAWMATVEQLGAGHPMCRHVHPKGCTNVQFILTRASINAFGRYIDTATMLPGHTVTIYPHKHH